MSKARLVITAVVLEHRQQAEVARSYGVSESWVSKLVARHRAEGEAAFEPRSRRPHTSPTAIPTATIDLIFELRERLTTAGLDAGPDTVTTRYEPAIDLDSLVAIDVHTHVEEDDHGHYSLDDHLMDASAAYFKADQLRTPTLDQIAEYYRARRMAAVVFTVDAESATGHPPLSSEDIAAGAARNNDVLVPFGSVDPRKGAESVDKAVRLVDEYGVRGLKLHPSLQGFIPNDEAYYPLYEAMQDAGAVLLFHTGQTGIGAGLPGGRGIKLRYSDPMLIDDVAADFPNLDIIMAHPAVPWADAAISIATHKANVYIDLSGWLPKYFPPQLTRQISTLLRKKALFGSDFPVITPDRWMTSFEELAVKDEAKPLIFKENAARLLGLTT